MFDVPLEVFANLVEQSWNQLPPEWIEKLTQANISWEVADFADYNSLQKLGHSNPWSLLGLYTGVPMTAKRGMAPYEHPERIQLFCRPILALAESPEHLVRLIRHVLYHEIGHHFGMNEEELHEAQKNDRI